MATLYSCFCALPFEIKNNSSEQNIILFIKKNMCKHTFVKYVNHEEIIIVNNFLFI